MKSKNVILRGFPVSPGIAVGKVYIFKSYSEVVDVYDIDDIDKEIERFKNAIEFAKDEIIDVKKKLDPKIGEQYKDIFEAQILALEDKAVINKTIEEIKKTGKNADYVYKNVVGYIIDNMSQIDDPYLKDRIYDINDILNRVLRKLKQRDTKQVGLDKAVIIASYNLTPADTVNFEKKFVSGIVTETGGVTSHSSIMARALNIPAVVGIKGFLSQIKENDLIIVDGFTGTVVINPEDATIKTYNKKIKEYDDYTQVLMKNIQDEAVTIDGRAIEVSANVELIEELDEVKKFGGKGIGLLRTEFLYMNEKTFPSIAKQREFYEAAAKAIMPDNVIVRTVDVGGDKQIFVDKKEENPALGFRGIRVSLAIETIFREQLKAILLSSNSGNLKIMLPVVSCVEEVIKAKQIIQEVKREMEGEGIEFDKDIELGVMVEVPSCAILADEFAKYVDFFSVGTNDLTQYTLAVDRANEKVSNLFDSLDPAVLKLIDMSIKAAHDNDIWAGICGELASNPIAAPILIGLGADELSMSPVFIPEIKNIIKNLSYSECKEIAKTVLKMNNKVKVREYMNAMINEKMPNMAKYILGEINE